MEEKENIGDISDQPPPLPARPKTIKPEENEENDDEISQQMTASYSEISFRSGLSPDSPDYFIDEILKRPVTLGDDSLAEDLESKIKLSSPQAKKGETPPLVSHRGSTPNMSRLSKHSQIGNLDVSLLNDLENEAQHLATSVDNLTENLCGILHSISSITADNVDVYKNAVSKMSDDMDANIKSMYTMMAKAEEVTQTMKSVEAHAQRVKEIKRLVDLFESYL